MTTTPEQFEIAPGDEFLTVEEVARYLRVAPATVRAQARREELPGVKAGKKSSRHRWLFRRRAIEALLGHPLDPGREPDDTLRLPPDPGRSPDDTAAEG